MKKGVKVTDGQKTRHRHCWARTNTHWGYFLVQIVIFNVQVLFNNRRLCFCQAFICVFFKKYFNKNGLLTLIWILCYGTLISHLNAKLGYATSLILFLKTEPILSFYNHNLTYLKYAQAWLFVWFHLSLPSAQDDGGAARAQPCSAPSNFNFLSNRASWLIRGGRTN